MSTEPNSSSARRKYPRKSFRKAISCLVEGHGEVVEGVEIGEGGISFRSKSEMALAQKVIVNFFIPEGDFFFGDHDFKKHSVRRGRTHIWT